MGTERQHQRPLLARRVAGSLLALVTLLSACDSSSTPVAPGDATGATAGDPSEVLVQLGDYHLGAVPDMFVTGPELIVYSDGTVVGDLYEGISDGLPQFRLAAGTIPDDAMQELIDAASELPPTSPIGEAATDGFPLLLVVGDQRWEINDSTIEPFGSFLAQLRSAADTAATDAWEPSRWVVRPFGSVVCTATDRPGGDPLYDAPVYPHFLDEFPLGETSCADRP